MLDPRGRDDWILVVAMLDPGGRDDWILVVAMDWILVVAMGRNAQSVSSTTTRARSEELLPAVKPMIDDRILRVELRHATLCGRICVGSAPFEFWHLTRYS